MSGLEQLPEDKLRQYRGKRDELTVNPEARPVVRKQYTQQEIKRLFKNWR